MSRDARGKKYDGLPVRLTIPALKTSISLPVHSNRYRSAESNLAFLNNVAAIDNQNRSIDVARGFRR